MLQILKKFHKRLALNTQCTKNKLLFGPMIKNVSRIILIVSQSFHLTILILTAAQVNFFIHAHEHQCIPWRSADLHINFWFLEVSWFPRRTLTSMFGFSKFRPGYVWWWLGGVYPCAQAWPSLRGSKTQLELWSPNSWESSWTPMGTLAKHRGAKCHSQCNVLHN